jgi:hypothetical protein
MSGAGWHDVSLESLNLKVGNHAQSPPSHTSPPGLCDRVLLGVMD